MIFMIIAFSLIVSIMMFYFCAFSGKNLEDDRVPHLPSRTSEDGEKHERGQKQI